MGSEERSLGRKMRGLAMTKKRTALQRKSDVGEGGVLQRGDGSKRGFDDGGAFIELLVGDDEGHENADDVVERARRNGDEAVLVAVASDLLGFRVGGLARGGVANEFDGAHAAEAADVADQIPLALPAAGALFKLLADRERTSQQAFFLDGFDGGERSGARKRMATVSSAERAGAGRVHDFGAAGDSGDGHAAAERFGGGGEIGLDAEMFGGEPSSGAAKAGLHFVGDEKDAMAAANLLQELEVVGRRDDKAAFAENGLGDDRGDRFRRDGALEGVFEMVGKISGRRPRRVAIRIGVRNAIDVAGKGLEAGFVGMRFAGEGHGEKRAAVEGVFEANDGGPLGVGAGDFDGVFDGLGAGVHQDGFFRAIAGSERVEFFGHGDVAFVGSDGEAEMEEFVELLADCGGYTRRTMASVEAADAAGKIEIAIAVEVFDDRAFSARSENGRGVGGAAGNGGFAAGHERAGFGAGDFGADLDGFHDWFSDSEEEGKTRTRKGAGCGTRAIA